MRAVWKTDNGYSRRSFNDRIVVNLTNDVVVSLLMTHIYCDVISGWTIGHTRMRRERKIRHGAMFQTNRYHDRHLGFRFSAIILVSINIFAPNLVRGWKISSPRQPIGQKSRFRKCKMADGRRLEFPLWAIILVWINIFAQNLVPWCKISRLLRCIAQRSAVRKSNMADGRKSGKSKSYYYWVVDWDNFVWWLSFLA